ncbi:MAG: SulP family inorganic anion transporter [Ignavibacteria bacterium]|nr:SulP family inorganic anion transporter [Ignavibacteria bacterium]
MEANQQNSKSDFVEPKKKKKNFSDLTGDIFGGTAAMLVALPSAIAFGLIIYAPLGTSFSGQAALGGIIGTIIIGIITPLLGGTQRLVSAPCAPAAAVLSAFAAEMLHSGKVPVEVIPIYIILVSLFSGIFQLIVGFIGGGRFIKYIPYPVVAGYLSGVGVLIFIGQLPKLLGIKEHLTFFQSLLATELWRWESVVVGVITILLMLFASRVIKFIPAAIISLIGGVVTYFTISIFNNELLILEGNSLIIGPISASVSEIGGLIASRASLIGSIDFSILATLVVPILTLAVLLSIDTLKTCVVIDALTFSRHDSNKELKGQGLGNIVSALACGIPGAGTMGATLVNLNSGAKTKYSGVFVGVTAVLVLLLIGKFVAWIPISALAGILIVVAVRMVDKKSFSLLKYPATRFDFSVILVVVISAVGFSLITAAGVGIGLAILLFVRMQIMSSVIRRKFYGNQKFSKKIRLENEIEILSQEGNKSVILELQGQLFFGTTDQLLTELDSILKKSDYLVLDMKRVLSIDFTAANMLRQIHARIKSRNGFLIFSSVPLALPTKQNIKSYLEELGLVETDSLKFFDNLDLSLEWIEDDILSKKKILISQKEESLQLSEIELFRELDEVIINALKLCVDEHSFSANETIFEIGEESRAIYFIRSGIVKIILPLADGTSHHLASFGKGGYFGDMSFLDKGTRSANAVAVDDVELYILKRKKFKEVAKSLPELEGVFFKRLAYTMSHRLRQNNIELKALQEN